MCAELGIDIERDYFQWLCELVGINRMEKSYYALAKDLHYNKFYALVPHDENRASDGKELREDYLRMVNYPKYIEIEGECTMLEMLIALAKRMDFETSDPYELGEEVDRTAFWFWEMMDNIGLSAFSDDNYYRCGGRYEVNKIIEKFLERKYTKRGIGGIFPLRESKKDQRSTEIWGQMNSYLMEREVVR